MAEVSIAAKLKACRVCFFWDRFSFQHGLCRNKSPAFDAQTGGAKWPRTEHDDWCNDCAPDPQRLKEKHDG